VLEELEYALIAADVGLAATEEILKEVREQRPKDLREAVKQAIMLQLEPDARRKKLRKLGFKPDARKKLVELPGSAPPRSPSTPPGPAPPAATTSSS